MSVLTHDEILKAVESGEIRVEPFDPSMVGPASVDLHLGNRFYVFKKAHRVFRVTEGADFHEVTDEVIVPDGEEILINTGETVLGITRERITLSDSLCGWLEGRSRFARLGLNVHISAPFMQPGISNHQVLEMSNLGPFPLSVPPGIPVCQFVFQRTVGQARYAGRYRQQSDENF